MAQCVIRVPAAPPMPIAIGPDAPAKFATPGPRAPGIGVHEGAGNWPLSHSSVPIPARISHGMLYRAPTCW